MVAGSSVVIQVSDSRARGGVFDTYHHHVGSYIMQDTFKKYRINAQELVASSSSSLSF